MKANPITPHMPDLILAAREAGALIARHSAGVAGLNVIKKKDGTPVTLVDRMAEDIIVDVLRRLAPSIPIIAEERFSSGDRPSLEGAESFWLVDALDGTRDFLAGTGEYTVNIALIHKGVPTLGIIYAPERDALYYALRGQGAFAVMGLGSAPIPLQVRSIASGGNGKAGGDLTLVTSSRQNTASRINQLFNTYTIAQRKTCGSSLKFCMIAAGQADIYPRLGPTSEWDTAAGDAILREAGGALIDLDNGGGLLTYGKADKKFLNPAFVATTHELWMRHRAEFQKPFIPKQ